MMWYISPKILEQNVLKYCLAISKYIKKTYYKQVDPTVFFI